MMISRRTVHSLPALFFSSDPLAVRRLLSVPSCLLILLVTAPTVGAADWPQAAANAARTAHVTDEPRGPYKLVWTRRWGDEVILNTNQPVIVGGKGYVASVNGVIHAFELSTGKDLWQCDIKAPIGHALACDEKRVYAAAYDGSVYAFDRSTGKQAWRTELSRRGFSGGPLLMDGTVFVGNRDGVFYAIRTDNGKQVWQRDTGAPIVQTAAGADGLVVFVNEGMQAFCLDAASGDIVWRVGTIAGRTVRDYWPVIHKNRVVIRTACAGPRDLTGNMALLQKKFFWPVVWGHTLAKNVQITRRAETVDDIVNEQEVFVEFFKEHPKLRSFIVLNLSDGKEPYVASVGPGCRNTGTSTPPVLAGDGHLYTPFRTSAAHRGVMDITHCALGRFDIDTGRITKPILCGFSEVAKVVGVRTPFELTSDETVTMTSGGNIIFGFRSEGGGGAIDVTSRKTWRLPLPLLPFGTSNMQPPGNIPVVSGQYVVHTQFRHLVCYQGTARK